MLLGIKTWMYLKGATAQIGPREDELSVIAFRIHELMEHEDTLLQR